MKKSKVVTALRILLGLLLVFAGGTYFLMELPPMEGPAGALMTAFVASGYLMAFVKLTELVVGILILFNLWTPLALVILAPVSINVALFNLVFMPSAGALGYVLLLLNAYLMWRHKEVYEPLLKR